MSKVCYKLHRGFEWLLSFCKAIAIAIEGPQNTMNLKDTCICVHTYVCTMHGTAQKQNHKYSWGMVEYRAPCYVGWVDHNSN